MLLINLALICSLRICGTVHINDVDSLQKHITLKRLTSPYVLRTMLGFFSRRSRPIRSTENYFAQIWNQSRDFKAKNFELATPYMYFYGRMKSWQKR